MLRTIRRFRHCRRPTSRVLALGAGLALGWSLLAPSPAVAQDQPPTRTPEEQEAWERIEAENITNVMEQINILNEARARARERQEAERAAREAEEAANPQPEPEPEPEAPQADAPAKPVEGQTKPGPGAQQPAAQEPVQAPVQPEPPALVLSPFQEPVQLTTLLDLVREELDLQLIYGSPDIVGKEVVITSEIELSRDQVLPFMETLLQLHAFTLVRGPAGVFIVQKSDSVAPSFGEEAFAPTRIISTRGLQPSALQSAISAMTGGAQGQASTAGIEFLDELGLMIVTGPSQRTEAIIELVDRLAEQLGRMGFVRYELRYVAAATAVERLATLLSSSAPAAATPQGLSPEEAKRAQGAVRAAGASGGISALLTRLSVEPGSNALLFRGMPEEAETLQSILDVIDRPPTLISRWYPVGMRAAYLVANAGSAEGLGPTADQSESALGMGSAGSFGSGNFRSAQQPGVTQQQGTTFSGAGFVIYPEAGGFMYYGTEFQQQAVDALVERFAPVTTDDEVVYEFYKLKHSTAEDVALLIQDLLSGGVSATGTSELIPGSLGARGRQREGLPTRGQNPATGEAAEDSAIEPTEGTFVLADTQNNQVIVRAPRRLQPQFRRLVENIDLRRPQVYIEAQIVTVSDDKNFRLAVETQIISGQFGIQSNFGLSTPGDGFLDPRAVAPNLAGLTSAVVRSNSVPFILNAIQTDGYGRVVSTPKLLVDDNQEATLVSIDEQPFTQTNLGDTATTTAFAGYAEAGTNITVTPQISDGGYLRLAYDIELSSFTGASTGEGVPPPRRTDNVASESVTVPSDATIIVGGLNFSSMNETIIKIPLLGDIPIVGHAFRDTRIDESETTLYVFITPRIMRDEYFEDLRLITQGPIRDAKVEPFDLPAPEPERMWLINVPHNEALLEREEEAGRKGR